MREKHFDPQSIFHDKSSVCGLMVTDRYCALHILLSVTKRKICHKISVNVLCVSLLLVRQLLLF
jgi:hypothetical protein